MAARRAHNPKVVGSNPTPATNPEAKKALDLYKYFEGFIILLTVRLGVGLFRLVGLQV